MIANRLITLGLGYIAGIVLASLLDLPLPGWAVLPLAIAGLGWIGYQLINEHRWRATPKWQLYAAILLLAVPLGFWRTYGAMHRDTSNTVAAVLEQYDEGAMIQFRGQVRAEPERRDERRGDLDVLVDQIVAPGGAWKPVQPQLIRLSVYLPRRMDEQEEAFYRDLLSLDAYGYRIQASAPLMPIDPPANPGQFDYEGFLESQNIVERLSVNSWRAPKGKKGEVSIIDGESWGNPLMELALMAKEHYLRVYKQVMPDPYSRFAAGTTLGTRLALEDQPYPPMPEEVLDGEAQAEPAEAAADGVPGREPFMIPDMFRHTGVGHVLAVSGLHVTIISVLIYSILYLLGMRAQAIAPILIFALILFTLLTGAKPSSVRAAIMNSVVVLAMAYFRYDLRLATFIGLAVSSFFILVHKPLALYSAGFLLSFGAVLSLVLISPPIDRWLVRLRGAEMFAALIWGVGVYLLACFRFESLLSGGVWAFLFGLLLVGLRLGTMIKQKVPNLWGYGLEKIPAWLRMFLAAQLAIQLGMMVPLSAWFFGQFPVGGMIVNLGAIPLVGLVVQLGVLTGLIAFIPWLGMPLASVLGAMNTFLSWGFLEMTYWSARLFEFPATPKPSLVWMIAYYAALAGLIWLGNDGYRYVQRWLYRLSVADHPAAQRAPLYASWGLVGLLLLGGVLTLSVGSFRTLAPAVPDELIVIHGERLPIVAAVPPDGRAAVINAGSDWTARSSLFDALRYFGASSIDLALIAGLEPDAGQKGLPALMGKMPVRKVYLPVRPGPDESMLEAIGDTYLLQQAERGKRWAVAYDQAWEGLEDAAERAEQGRTEVLPTPRQTFWLGPNQRSGPGAVGMSVLNEGYSDARRFLAESRGRVVMVDFHGHRVLVISQTMPDELDELAESVDLSCDVLLLPDQHYGIRRIYPKLIESALRHAKPKAVVISRDPMGEDESPVPELIQRATTIPEAAVFLTSRDGAVILRRTGAGLKLTGHVSGRFYLIGAQ